VQNSWLPDAEGVVQLQAVRQGSNLAIFKYTSIGLFGGMRWRW
jgi:hypothetical protein